jgi:hypothetical protein
MRLFLSFLFFIQTVSASSIFTYEAKHYLDNGHIKFFHPKVKVGNENVNLWATGGIFNDGTLPSSAFPRHLSGVCIGLKGANSSYASMSVTELSDRDIPGAIVENIDNSTAIVRYIANFDEHPYWPPINLSQNYPIASIICN